MKTNNKTLFPEEVFANYTEAFNECLFYAPEKEQAAILNKVAHDEYYSTFTTSWEYNPETFRACSDVNTWILSYKWAYIDEEGDVIEVSNDLLEISDTILGIDGAANFYENLGVSLWDLFGKDLVDGIVKENLERIAAAAARRNNNNN